MFAASGSKKVHEVVDASSSIARSRRGLYVTPTLDPSGDPASSARHTAASLGAVPSVVTGASEAASSGAGARPGVVIDVLGPTAVVRDRRRASRSSPGRCTRPRRGADGGEDDGAASCAHRSEVPADQEAPAARADRGRYAQRVRGGARRGVARRCDPEPAAPAARSAPPAMNATVDAVASWVAVV